MQETNKHIIWVRELICSLKTPTALGEKNGEISLEDQLGDNEAESMSSRERKKAALYKKLMRLRDVTNSSALKKTSIVVDASKYIEELKQKVENLNQEIGTSQISTVRNSLPVVTVETLEKGFLINVYSEKNSSGLLVSVLEAFEELGLEVLDARVSCSDSFHLEAIGGDNIEGNAEGLDAQVVKQAVLQAIDNVQE